MQFLLSTLTTHRPDPVSGERRSALRSFGEIVDGAVLAEELGFDGYGVGERNERPFLSAPAAAVLGAIVARTERIRLFTAVEPLGLLDPARAIRDYSALDQLAGGRLDLVVGQGRARVPGRVRPIAAEAQRERARARCERFRAAWDEAGERGRRLWHGDAVSPEAVDEAARRGEPVLLDNGFEALGPDPALAGRYRRRWAFHRHDPAAATVAVNHGDYYAESRSQRALAAYRPIFAARLKAFGRLGVAPAHATLEEAVAAGAVLVGSPAQIAETLHRQHELFGHQVAYLHADGYGLTAPAHRASLELFPAAIAPALPGQRLAVA